MNDGELLCNYQRCRRRLIVGAWVTFCSHIFCEDDGNRYLSELPCECPACSSRLTTKGDILRVDLDPSEQFKSMILAGLRPEVIVEICSRAYNFWNYQIDQERRFQEQKAEQLLNKLTEMADHYGRLLRAKTLETVNLSRQLESSRRDCEVLKEQRETVSERLAEKNRQYLKLQGLYDSLRRRTMPPIAQKYFSPNSESLLHQASNDYAAYTCPNTSDLSIQTVAPPVISAERKPYSVAYGSKVLSQENSVAPSVLVTRPTEVFTGTKSILPVTANTQLNQTKGSFPFSPVKVAMAKNQTLPPYQRNF